MLYIGGLGYTRRGKKNSADVAFSMYYREKICDQKLTKPC